jgi:serine/threonine-protein kinase RsbW
VALDYVDDSELRTLLGDVVELRVAADAGQLLLLRLLTECIAARADFFATAIIDTTLAVNEAAASLMDRTTATAWLDCTFTTYDEEITITLCAPTKSRETLDTETLGWQLLTELSSSITFRTEPDTANTGWKMCVRLTMRSRNPVAGFSAAERGK